MGYDTLGDQASQDTNDRLKALYVHAGYTLCNQQQGVSMCQSSQQLASCVLQLRYVGSFGCGYGLRLQARFSAVGVGHASK